MIIEPDEERWTIVIGYLVLQVIVFLIIILSEKDAGLIYSIPIILSDICLVPDCIVTWKTIIMDENGCTLKWFKYERTYSWEDLVVKRLENNPYNIYTKGISNDWAFFSSVPVRKSTKSNPITYCTFRHPMRSFYIFLASKRDIERYSKDKYNYEYRVYLVDKKEFLSKMDEWGVKLTEK